ncbi:hypothetical protein AVEN_243796-1 [Araneus ventricosus]|uniref:Uncharacterized protein n=1 Tax=Araneus ventricosus TaxID=182803 RepID=A0A4Y2A6X0_ARAVE|nr:hypothetical protein AVEN_243796-1 [Araneus ventricosus]
MKAQIWSLEKEREALQAKLDLNVEMSSSIKELIPKIDELREKNKQSLIVEISKIIKEVACQDIKSSVQIANKEIAAEVKKNEMKRAPLPMRPSNHGTSPLLRQTKKNVFLANSNNKPHFIIEFSIPARDKRSCHWVLSINPKKFEEILLFL